MSRHGCYNKPRPTADSYYIAQVGWKDTYHDGLIKPFRIPVYAPIHSAFGTTACQYTQSNAADPQCSGCVHRAKETT